MMEKHFQFDILWRDGIFLLIEDTLVQLLAQIVETENGKAFDGCSMFFRAYNTSCVTLMESTNLE